MSTHNILSYGSSEGFGVDSQPTSWRDNEVWNTSTREDIQLCTKAFEKTMSKLNYCNEDKLDESQSTVGPQEHLDSEIHIRMSTVSSALEPAGAIDDIPQKVLNIVETVVGKATDGNTSSYPASLYLENTQHVFSYGRKVALDKFNLSHKSHELLDQYDARFTEVLDLRLKVELEQSEQVLEDCYQILDRADNEGRLDQQNVKKRIEDEDSIVTMEDIEQTHNEVRRDLGEEKLEYEEIMTCCTSDINIIDESMEELHHIMESSKQQYMERSEKREQVLMKNRTRQEELRKELKHLEEQEEELTGLAQEEMQLQEIADSEYRSTSLKVSDWRKKIMTLNQQAEVCSSIIEDMKECTELILTDANEKKKVWTRGLSQMKIKNLLEIRDVLIAKICLNQMEMEDCTENLKISESEISNMEKDKRAKARTGFKQMVTELEQKIKNYNVTIDEQRNKFDGHKAKIEHLEDELRLVDGEIKSLNGQVHLDNPRDRYNRMCHIRKLVYDKEDIRQANFNSHGKYN